MTACAKLISCLCSLAGPSSGNGSPKGRSNSTTKVYFVGKEISSSVPTNLNGHIKHSAAPTEIQTIDKVIHEII